jgi:2-polyprenyl-3-methyl-5-hydroxy-6-metoxy-1,4-benzoquinol methylase
VTLVEPENKSEGTLIVLDIASSMRANGQVVHRINQLLVNGLLSRDTATLAQILYKVANEWSPEIALTSEQEHARELLAQEWRDAAPATPEEIAEFYRISKHVATDLHAWHATSGRQEWTNIIVHLAKRIKAQIVVDIGCGAGYELLALKETGIPELYGVEPNDQLRQQLQIHVPCMPSIEHQRIPIEQADMLICLDVLEHVVGPEEFCGKIASWAKSGCYLAESTATFDHSTPLHLEANHGWMPDVCLGNAGWKLLNDGRVRVWQKS